MMCAVAVHGPAGSWWGGGGGSGLFYARIDIYLYIIACRYKVMDARD